MGTRNWIISLQGDGWVFSQHIGVRGFYDLREKVLSLANVVRGLSLACRVFFSEHILVCLFLEFLNLHLIILCYVRLYYSFPLFSYKYVKSITSVINLVISIYMWRST